MAKKKKPVRYDWDRWFRKKKFTLVYGKQYRCLAHGMTTQIRTAAIARGLRVSVHVGQDLTITVLRKPPKKNLRAIAKPKRKKRQ